MVATIKSLSSFGTARDGGMEGLRGFRTSAWRRYRLVVTLYGGNVLRWKSATQWQTYDVSVLVKITPQNTQLETGILACTLLFITFYYLRKR